MTDRLEISAALSVTESAATPGACKFSIGQRVTKTKGSNWTGHVVGYYSTALTAIGYAVESETEKGSVQIYPETALTAEPAGEEPLAMTAEDHRLEDLKQMAAYSGPIVSFEVREPYYLASCDHCGWVGSSELCGTDSFGDDSDVFCPRCGTAGADCGKVSGRIPSLQGNPESLHDKARRDAEAILGRLRAGGYRASIANVEKMAKYVLKITAPVAAPGEEAE